MRGSSHRQQPQSRPSWSLERGLLVVHVLANAATNGTAIPDHVVKAAEPTLAETLPSAVVFCANRVGLSAAAELQAACGVRVFVARSPGHELAMDVELDKTGELIARVRQGGQVALAELFMENRDRLRRMIQIRLDHRVMGRVDPSDVLQDAFMDASHQLGGYLADPPMAPFLWLRFLTGQRLMATHRFHLGAQMRNAKQEVPLWRNWVPGPNSASLSCHLAGRLTSPSLAAARMELQARLQELVDGLDTLDREILSLRHFEELSNNEAAEELGISKAAASKRYIRALERLRKALPNAP